MKHLKILLILAAAGLLFSGYLSATKLLTGDCAFNEPCPYFLGYPACWYGFAMYLFMFAATVLGVTRIVDAKMAVRADAIVSFLGIIFAGRFALQEFLGSQFTGLFGFSTCVYGLIFYILIFVISLTALRKSS